MFKNVIYLVSVILLISFNSCSEEEIIVKDEAKGDIFNNSMYSLEVDDNTLVFESEKTFNSFLDYLNEVGDDNFDKVEKEIGFMSLRRSENKPDGYSKIEDPLIATLLNPECEIVIAGYKFRVNLVDEITKVSNLEGDSFKSKSIEIEEELELDWDDSFFDMLEYGNLKGWFDPKYCTQDKEKYKEWVIMRGLPDYLNLKAKVCFQRFSFINTIIVKFKCEDMGSYWEEEGVDVYCHANTFKYERKGENEKSETLDKRATFYGSGHKISERPFWGTRRVEYYDVDVDFVVENIDFYDLPNSVNLSMHCDMR
ncbi:MAG: hypothetical protein PF486_09340 [Prolixibacteraceae bacterium]|jgi:hypothetical protein|nr:hypothetical protein [Prolixibacteraceae bacterium]